MVASGHFTIYYGQLATLPAAATLSGQRLSEQRLLTSQSRSTRLGFVLFRDAASCRRTRELQHLRSVTMSKPASSPVAAAIVCVCCLGAASAVAETGLKAVPGLPGAFEPQGGPGPESIRGKPLAAAQVESLAGKPDGYDILGDGASLFGMESAHRAGRREPLRPLAADLSDWNKAPQCPPDRVLVDPRTGRVRFFSGHDPAKFQSEVVASFRGTHGDWAFARWRGNTLFLSHWESSYHVWAYDAGNPSAPVKIGELPVANFAHGFVVLDSGWGLMGTTGKGVMLLDLRDPRKMEVVKSLVPEYDWVDVIAPGYVAVWQAKKGPRDDPRGPRVFDASKLPDKVTEVTETVQPDVRRYLADRIDPAGPDGPAWFRLADTNLALVDLGGGPAAWKITRTVPLPELSPAEQKVGGWLKIRLETLTPGKRFVLLYPAPGGKNRLQVLDVSGGKVVLSAPVEAAPTASHLSLFAGKYAYVSVLPTNRGGGQVDTWDGTHLDIYDLSDPANPKQVGTWDPGFPTRDMQLIPHPGRQSVVLVKEEGFGFGMHFADLSDPLRPRVLVSAPLGFEGNRVAAWGDKAMYTSSTLGQWFDFSDPLAPKRLGNWFNHRWFFVRTVYGSRAVVTTHDQTEIIDLGDPGNPREVWDKAPVDTAWGTRLYGSRGGPKSGRGPVSLTIADMAGPAQPRMLSQTVYPMAELDTGQVNGLFADGSLLYGVTEGDKGKAVFLIWDVADPKKPVLLAQLHHPELCAVRGEWFWTAQGHVIAAAHGIAVITSYGSGPPEVIDARDPRKPKFLGRLPYQGSGNEMSDCWPDGRWFYIKSYNDPVQLWDFSRPEQPRRIWQESGVGPYGYYAWQAGVPVGPVLLVPQLSVLKVLTVPRPAQVPAGKLTWR
jgi:hypothetical protein